MEGSKRLRKVNKRGYRDLVLATKEMSLTIVGNAKTDDFPSGNLQSAWKKLEKKWDPKSREDRVDSLTKFMKLMLEDIHIKPPDWLPHMEKKKSELTNAGYIMHEETYLAYVLASLSQEQYQTMILVLKDKLRRGTLMIEEAENLLDSEFEAMKELN